MKKAPSEQEVKEAKSRSEKAIAVFAYTLSFLAGVLALFPLVKIIGAEFHHNHVEFNDNMIGFLSVSGASMAGALTIIAIRHYKLTKLNAETDTLKTMGKAACFLCGPAFLSLFALL